MLLHVLSLHLTSPMLNLNLDGLGWWHSYSHGWTPGSFWRIKVVVFKHINENRPKHLSLLVLLSLPFYFLVQLVFFFRANLKMFDLLILLVQKSKIRICSWIREVKLILAQLSIITYLEQFLGNGHSRKHGWPCS